MAKKRRKQKGGFVKVYKNRAYFKRFQVKFRRRREGKTDYYARKRLIAQDKNKYNSPKYRLIVRFTNKDVICQVAYSKIVGDIVLSAAYSHELPKYGIKTGLTNYSAAYATGLLLARRLLSKYPKLNQLYPGNTENVGEQYLVEEAEDGPKPFYALLDVGLRRTSTGSKVFAALKGACDGGLEVPHSESRFVGFDPESKELNSDVLRKYIFGGHVADYMTLLKENEPEKYKKQFSQYISAGVAPGDIEGIYEKAHAAIRKDPSFTPSGKKHFKGKRHNAKRLTLEERKKGIEERIAVLQKAKQEKLDQELRQ